MDINEVKSQIGEALDEQQLLVDKAIEKAKSLCGLRVFGMDVSLTFFETKKRNNDEMLNPENQIKRMSLPHLRGGAEIDTGRVSPKMLIAVAPSSLQVEENGVIWALDKLQAELNHNIDHLKEKFAESENEVP